MPLEQREIYASSNGDRWSLVRDADGGGVFVQHKPNRPSGGRTTRIEIGEFLSAGTPRPEQEALLRLIGSLVAAGNPPTADDPARVEVA